MTQPTKVPGIPKPPSSLDPATRRYLEVLAEAVEIRLGRRGDPIDRAVTLRELIDGGLALKLKHVPFDPNRSGNVGFGPNEEIDSSVPPPPTNFQAAGAYSVINLSWTYPNYGNHAYTEIYRADSDTGDKQLVGVSSGRAYLDAVGSDVSFYYWIRFVSTSGVIGPFNSSSGTLATTAADVDHLLNTLADAISTSELTATLRSELNSYQTATDVNTAVSDAVDLISTGIPIWSAAGVYDVDDVVRSADGKLYICISAVTASTNDALPTDNTPTTHWRLYGDYSAIEDAANKIIAINTLSTTSTSAAAQRIAGINSVLYDANDNPVVSSSNLSTMKTSLLNSDGTTRATATQLDYLSSQYVNPETGTANNVTLQQALNTSASKVSVAAERIASINSILYDANDNPVVSSSNLSTMKTSLLNSDGTTRATATQLDYLSSQYVNPETGTANNVTLQQALNTSASNIDGLRGEYTVKVDANGHVAGFGLANTYDNVTDSATSEFYVNADRFAILPNVATSVTPLWSASTTYTAGNQVKHNGKLYIAGISHSPSTASTSARTPDPNNETIYWVRGTVNPFTVQASGFTHTDGTYVPPGVYMNTANIKYADITHTKIGSVNADTITTGTLNVTDRIETNSIEASKILLDGVTLTETTIASGPNAGKLALGVDAISANAIESGTLNAGLITVTNLFADNIAGDINTLVPFSLASPVQIAGGNTQVWAGQFPAQTIAKKPYISVVGFGIWENDVVYKVDLQMKVNSGSTTHTVGTVVSATTQTFAFGTFYIATFSGDKLSVLPSGAVLKVGSTNKGTVNFANYNSSTNVTQVYYYPTSGGVATGQTVTSTPVISYQTVSTIMFRADYDDHPEPFAITGGLSQGVTATVDARIMIDTLSTNYQALPFVAHNNNWAHDQVFDLDGLMMSLR